MENSLTKASLLKLSYPLYEAKIDNERILANNRTCIYGESIQKESLQLKFPSYFQCAIDKRIERKEKKEKKKNGDKIGSKRPVPDLVRVATCYGGDTGNFAIR